MFSAIANAIASPVRVRAGGHAPTIRLDQDLLPDKTLIRRVASGRPGAFEALFDRHRRSALSLAGRICGSSLAEEAVQEAFLQVSRGASSYTAELGSVRTWLLGIVRLRAIDARRRDDRHSRRRADTEWLDAVAEGDELEVTVLRRDAAREVRLLLGDLPAEQAHVLRLAYFHQLSHQEIAERLGLPVGTVKGRIRLGLGKLRAPLAATAAAV